MYDEKGMLLVILTYQLTIQLVKEYWCTIVLLQKWKKQLVKAQQRATTTTAAAVDEFW